MSTPYTILGVQKNADEKAIKSAFRKLAMKYHPDQNPDDTSAQQKFAEVNQAYEIVGDKEKRKQYDRGEIDETGKPKFSGFQGGNPFGGGQRQGGSPFGGSSTNFSGAEDILSDILGSAFGGQAQASRGARQHTQFDMGGMGRGAAPSLDLEMNAAVTIDDLMRGKTNVRMPDGKQIAVSIPAEAEEGQTIRLKGKGKSAPGRNPGDALVTLKMRRHSDFERFGVDLRTNLSLPLKTAVLGGKVEVATLDGKLSLKVPAKTNSGKLFRLKGKGLPKKAGGFGDLLVNTVIHVADDELVELEEFLKNKV